MKEYTEPGMYVAICNKLFSDEYFVKVFEFPTLDIRVVDLFQCGDMDVYRAKYSAGEQREWALEFAGKQTAFWWYRNKVEIVNISNVEAVYPIEIFQPLFEEVNANG